MPAQIHSYRELLNRKDGPPGSSWGLFGDSGDLGTINFQSPERIVAACQAVTRGASFRLDLEVEKLDPPITKHRHPSQHVIFSNGMNHRDDYLERMYLQNGSHLDGLRHIRHHVHGFYNHTPDEAVNENSRRLGIGAWAKHGVVGRAVLLDIDRSLKRSGRQIDHANAEAFGVDVLDACVAEQNVEIRPGDMLLIRTGWIDYLLNTLDYSGRVGIRENLRSPGLEQSHAVLEWLWDRQISLIAADNAAVESYPPAPNSEFFFDPIDDPNGHVPGMIHPQLLALLGFPVGELWNLDELAADCAEDGRYDCLLVVAPMNLPAGVGSPANATAIK